MSFEINYTREVETNTSELVDEAYYNENTGDLYVDLDSSVYKYSNVPASVVEEFEAADSAGSFYGTNIKPKYGPGERLGSWTRARYEQVPVESLPAPTPVVASNHYSLTVSPETSTASTIVVDRTNHFSLKPFSDEEAGIAVEGVEREYLVTFEVDGLVDFKRHTLKSSSVDEAVNAVLDLGKMLDLNFVVREVCIKFA